MAGYPFPPIKMQDIHPQWQQGCFVMGDQSVLVLDYLAGRDNFGWSDGLTDFHETEAGDNHFIDQASRADALRELHRHIKKPDPVILEIGCSSGYMLEAIRQDFPCAFVMGADIVREPLERLAKKMPHVPLMRFDMTQCPLPDASVDAIVLLNVLEHVEADDKAMAQIKRILKPGGVAIIEVPAGPHLYDIYDKILMHFRRYTKSSLKALAKSAGMKVRRSSHLGFFLYPGFWFVKKRNRSKYTQANITTMKNQVAQNIRSTRQNPLLSWLMSVELWLGKWLPYPTGIRCLMTCSKAEKVKCA